MHIIKFFWQSWIRKTPSDVNVLRNLSKNQFKWFFLHQIVIYVNLNIEIDIAQLRQSSPRVI